MLSEIGIKRIEFIDDIFNVKQKDSLFEAIGFRMIDEYEKLIKGKPLDIIYNISENHWNGKISLQLEIKEIRYSNVNV